LLKVYANQPNTWSTKIEFEFDLIACIVENIDDTDLLPAATTVKQSILKRIDQIFELTTNTEELKDITKDLEDLKAKNLMMCLYRCCENCYNEELIALCPYINTENCLKTLCFVMSCPNCTLN